MSDQPEVIDFESWAAQRGASLFGLGDSALHKSNSSVSKIAWQRALKYQSDLDDALIKRRVELRAEYNQLLIEGKIRELNYQERLIKTASGHPDLAPTQAARRLLKKHFNYDWPEEAL